MKDTIDIIPVESSFDEKVLIKESRKMEPTSIPTYELRGKDGKLRLINGNVPLISSIDMEMNGAVFVKGKVNYVSGLLAELILSKTDKVTIHNAYKIKQQEKADAIIEANILKKLEAKLVKEQKAKTKTNK